MFPTDAGLVELDARTATLRSLPELRNDRIEPYGRRFGLSRDDRLYVATGDREHPNRAKILDLRSARTRSIGNGAFAPDHLEVTGNAHELFFVTQFEPDVRVAKLGSSVVTPRVLLKGRRTRLDSPGGIAFDARGDVCVLEHDAPRVECFAPRARGDAAPSAVIEAGGVLRSVDAMAFDRDDDCILTGTLNDGRTGIAVFDRGTHGRRRAQRIIAGKRTRLARPYSIAADRRGTLYVADLGNDPTAQPSLLVFERSERGNAAPAAVFSARELDGIDPFHVVVEPRSDAVIIDDWRSSVLVTNAAAPGRETAHRLASLTGQVAAGDDGTVVTNFENDAFGIFTTDGASSREIGEARLHRAQLHDPEFVSVAPDDSVWFGGTSGALARFSSVAAGDADPISNGFARFARADADALRGFAAGVHGTVYFSRAHPDSLFRVDGTGGVRRISGPATGLAEPDGIAIDTAGRVYVANPGNASVTVYAPSPLGNVPPIRTIAGRATRLHVPRALAVDDDGTVYVLDGPPEHDGTSSPAYHVFAFAPAARGDAAPVRTYDVRADCFTNDHI